MKHNDMITKCELISFLEKMTQELQNGTMTEQQQRNLSMYYIQTKYVNEIDSSISDGQKSLQYITLGWYIHNFLLTDAEKNTSK